MGGVTVFGEQPKTCTECGVTKPAGSFYVAPGMRDGRMAVGSGGYRVQEV